MGEDKYSNKVSNGRANNLCINTQKQKNNYNKHL